MDDLQLHHPHHPDSPVHLIPPPPLVQHHLLHPGHLLLLHLLCVGAWTCLHLPALGPQEADQEHPGGAGLLEPSYKYIIMIYSDFLEL